MDVLSLTAISLSEINKKKHLRAETRPKSAD
jgi:hypothetical protein